jgi:putative heme-binding domain-containing protein
VQILEPSRTIHEKYRTSQFVLESGRVVSGVVIEESPDTLRIATNLLAPEQTTVVRKAEIEDRIPSQVSPMPVGLLNVLTREEILDLVSFVEAGDRLPAGVVHGSAHGGTAPNAAPTP